MKLWGPLFFVTAVFGITFFFGGYQDRIGELISTNSTMTAAVFFTQSTTSDELHAAFASASSTKKLVKILLVPGHEPNFGGAEYRDLKERDLNADLALSLAQYFVEDGHYEVFMTRGKDGWNPLLGNYFVENAVSIRNFVDAQWAEMNRLVQESRIIRIDDVVPHNDAPSDVALRLYGINKWANENDIDIVLHVHFNDSGPRKNNQPGDYNGLSIYTPERQYSNAQVSADISKHLLKRLSRMFPVSNHPGEKVGVVEDQELIAVGSANTLDGASLLMEYGYIYEPQFQVDSVRGAVIKELALQTYLGITDFFREIPIVGGSHQSTLLPYEGNTIVKKTTQSTINVLKFQAALSEKGYYPPENYSRNDCPVSGFFWSCTKIALINFQQELGIKGEGGIVGPKTRAELRKLFEPSMMSKR